jgi:hypothetical protein
VSCIICSAAGSSKLQSRLAALGLKSGIRAVYCFGSILWVIATLLSVIRVCVSIILLTIESSLSPWHEDGNADTNVVSQSCTLCQSFLGDVAGRHDKEP